MYIATNNPALNLRLLAESDEAELFALVDGSRHFLSRWLPWVDKTKRVEDTREFLRGAVYRHTAGQGSTFALVLKEQISGVIGHNQYDLANRCVTLGYWLAEKHCGQGAMAQAARAMIDYTMSTLEMNRVEIRVAVGNKPSQAVCARLGLAHDGVLRQAEWLGNRFVDLAVNSVLRSEWPVPEPGQRSGSVSAEPRP